MTPEQIQRLIDDIKYKLMLDDDVIGESGLLYLGEKIHPHGDFLMKTLTQALEIAKGESVVVPREPTKKMTDFAKLSCDFKTSRVHWKRAYKTMIAVAENSGA